MNKKDLRIKIMKDKSLAKKLNDLAKETRKEDSFMCIMEVIFEGLFLGVITTQICEVLINVLG